EQLLIVEPAGRARVSRTKNVAGLDLQVGYRVGARALTEHQVAVLFVGVGTSGFRSDEDIANPDRVSALAVQCALVVDAALGVLSDMLDVDALLDVLAGVRE